MVFTLPVPGAPPRKVEVEAVNSTALMVSWKPPLTLKHHGQIQGYQLIYARLHNGEPHGQPVIMDISLPDAEVLQQSCAKVQILNSNTIIKTMTGYDRKMRWNTCAICKQSLNISHIMKHKGIKSMQSRHST